jgi:hypothetical protein
VNPPGGEGLVPSLGALRWRVYATCTGTCLARFRVSDARYGRAHVVKVQITIPTRPACELLASGLEYMYCWQRISYEIRADRPVADWSQRCGQAGFHTNEPGTGTVPPTEGVVRRLP